MTVSRRQYADAFAKVSKELPWGVGQNLLRLVERGAIEHGQSLARAEVAALKRRIRIAKRALRKSTKYEPWDDFEWTASIALDLRRTDYARKPLPKRGGR